VGYYFSPGIFRRGLSGSDGRIASLRTKSRHEWQNPITVHLSMGCSMVRLGLVDFDEPDEVFENCVAQLEDWLALTHDESPTLPSAEICLPVAHDLVRQVRDRKQLVCAVLLPLLDADW